MLIDRRLLLGAAASGVALAAAGPVLGRSSPASGDQALEALLQALAEGLMRRSPEEATRSDFDTGVHAGLRAALDDRSLDARAAEHAAVRQALADLRAIAPANLSGRAALDRDVALYVYETLDDLLGRYGYVDINLRPSPYVVSQMNGAYYWLPEFIGGRHPIADAADVDAWFARLASLATVIDQESDRIRHDAGLGVIPPDFVIAKTIAQIIGLRDRPPLESALIAPALAKMAALGRQGDGARAERIFRGRIAPALDRQIAALEAVAPRAVDIAGVWRLPDGDAYYAAAVRSNTTVAIAPGDLHQLGLEQCRALIAQIDTLLKGQGLSQGSVGARIGALNKDPRFTVSNDDAGRAKLLALAEAHIAAITARLPQAFGIVEMDPIVVRRVAPAIEAGAPGAFYSGGAPGQPGQYSLNLRDPAEHATWRLATLTHHEAVPGHHFQYSVLARAPALPLFRRVVRFSAYTEGYALYAEQVAAELGMFEGDAFGRIGELQSQLFRAARIVVDTGIHHERWTREQAIAWMVDNAGEQPLATDREVTRYAVYPGQACSFKVGATRIAAAREAARATMGARFDVRRFHDFILTSGPMPMAVLEKAVAQWAAA
ncbi:DUF885 domain-containing protein [Sphingomonas flavalba]|uniref:DUF885 domain-containing protein n=1 Tax=Sphingomonas flavalba TaxID=2559804 RepID=UPI0039E1D6B9